MFWTDPVTGVAWKGRIDWLRDPHPGRPTIAVDLKTTNTAHPIVLPKTVDDYSYHLQDAVYEDGLNASGLGANGVAFIFVFVEKEPPHCVSVGQVDPDDVAMGRVLAQRAAEIWRDCNETGIWPAYQAEIHTITLPAWARRKHEGTLLNDY